MQYPPAAGSPTGRQAGRRGPVTGQGIGRRVWDKCEEDSTQIQEDEPAALFPLLRHEDHRPLPKSPDQEKPQRWGPDHRPGRWFPTGARALPQLRCRQSPGRYARRLARLKKAVMFPAGSGCQRTPGVGCGRSSRQLPRSQGSEGFQNQTSKQQQTNVLGPKNHGLGLVQGLCPAGHGSLRAGVPGAALGAAWGGRRRDTKSVMDQ